MAAGPVSIVPIATSNARRRPLALTQRRLDANRRNAAPSTGPRTAEGKADDGIRKHRDHARRPYARV